jgi:hypothetical protein
MLWCIPLLLVPPVLSPDLTLYADVGWEVEQGHNPYLLGLAQSGGPYDSQVDPLWRGTGVAYPPLAVLIMRWMAALIGFHPYYGYIAMRIPVLLSVAALLWLVPRIADAVGVHRRQALWLGVLNPLLVLHLVGGGHNDAAMIAVTVFAIWLVARWPKPWMSLLVAPLAVGVAMALKQQGGLAVVAVAGLPLVLGVAGPTANRLAAPNPLRPSPVGDHESGQGSDRPAMSQLPSRLAGLLTLTWRTAVATVVALAAFIGICFGSGLGLGWMTWLDLMGKAATPAPLAMLSKLGSWLVFINGGDATVFARNAGLVTTGILAVAVLLVYLHFHDRPLAVVAWGSLVVAVGGQAMHPWYLPWSLVLLGLVSLTLTQRRWVYGLALAFTIWNAVQTVLWHGQYR